MNYALALALKGKVISFDYKGQARTVRINQVENCKNGNQVIRGIDHVALDKALNTPGYEIGNELDFTKTFRLNEMSNVTAN